MTQLLRKTVPIASVHAPGVIMSRQAADDAMAAVKASSSFANLQGLSLVDGFDMLADPHANLKSARIFEENVNRLRGELYVGGHDDPQRRFELHQLLMISGFYSRAANQHTTPVDPQRFLSNHYNFDVRRDKHILDAVKDAAFNPNPKTASNDLLGELLVTERHLYGQHRLQPITGKQYMMPGVSLRLVKTEEELLRLLDLPPVKEHGNFETVIGPEDGRITTLSHGRQDWSVFQKAQHQERWDSVLLRCKPEAEAPAAPPMKMYAPDEDEAQFRLRVLRPAPPLTWAERMREFALQLWVYWFGFWVLFWMVDEELITFIGLIFARYQQLAFLREEAKRSGGKVYMATSRMS